MLRMVITSLLSRQTAEIILVIVEIPFNVLNYKTDRWWPQWICKLPTTSSTLLNSTIDIYNNKGVATLPRLTRLVELLWLIHAWV